MTDPRPPLTDDDLSAALDGEAGPDVLTRLAQDPAAQQRVAELRAVGDTLRAAPVAPLDASVVDQLVGRALAEADAGPPGALDPVVTPLAPARSRRSAPPWLVAAAVAVLVAVGLGLVWSGRGDDGDTNDTAAVSFDEDAGGDASGPGPRAAREGNSEDGASPPEADDVLAAEPGDTGSSGGGAPAAAEDLLTLGDFPHAAALRRALATAVPPGRPLDPDAAPTSEEVARCDTQARHVFELEEAPTATAVATVDGDDVLVFEYERASFQDDTTLTTFVTVIDPTTCTPILSFERDPG